MKKAQEPDFRLGARFLWSIVVILIVQTTALFLLTMRMSAVDARMQTLLERVGADASADLLDGYSRPSIGPADAQVTVVEFSEFQCPECAQAAQVMNELIARYSDRVRFVHRHATLDQDHWYAFAAAAAAECAYRQDKFWEMYAVLYANYDQYTPDALRGYALQVGLDLQTFAECSSDESVEATVLQDWSDGSRNVEVLPAFFIDGRLFPDAPTFENLSQAIESELAAAGE